MMRRLATAAAVLLGAQACIPGSPEAEHQLKENRDDEAAAASNATVLFRAEHPDAVYALSFAPDDRLLATGCRDGSVRLFDVGTGSLLKTLTTPVGNHIAAVEFFQDGRRVVAGSYDHPDFELRIWDVQAGTDLQRFGDSDGSVAGASVDSLSLSPSGTHLADNRFRVWDLDTLQATWLRDDTWSRCVRYSPAGTTLAFAMGEAGVELWNPQTREKVRSLEHADAHRVAFSPDGTSLVSSGPDGSLLVWNPQTGRRRFVLAGHTGTVWCVAFHPNGKLVASGADDRTVRLWDVAAGRPVAMFTVHPGSVRAVAFSHDGRRLAAGSYQDHLLVVWEFGGG